MTTYYVSKSTDNGMVVGSDANAGTSLALPKLTISNAVTTASTGDTIYVNKGSWTGAELGATNYVNINGKTLTLLPYNAADNVTIVGSASLPQIRVQAAPSSVETIIGAFILDGGNLTSTNGVQIDETVGVDTRVTLAGTTIRDQTTAHISDNALRGIVKLYNVTFAGTIRNGYAGAATFGAAAAKSTIVNGLALSCTFNTASATCTVIGGTRSAVSANNWTVDVRNVTGTIGVGSACDTSSALRVVAPIAASPWVVSNNSFNMSNTVATAADSYGIFIRNGASGDTAKSNNGFCQNNTIGNFCYAGFGIRIGDGATVYDVDNATVSGNRVFGIYSATATPHGISIGAVTGGNVYNNEVFGSYVGFLLAGNQGANVFNNLSYGCYGPDFYAKGCGATTRPTIAHNIAVADNTYVGAKRDFGMFSAVINGATNSTAVLFQNNIGYALNDFSGWASVPASQAATYTGNNYFSAYTLPSSVAPFAFAGTATVTGDTFFDPGFALPKAKGLLTLNSRIFRPKRSFMNRGAQLKNAAGAAITLPDYNGAPRSQPPTHGPFEVSQAP